MANGRLGVMTCKRCGKEDKHRDGYSQTCQPCWEWYIKTYFINPTDEEVLQGLAAKIKDVPRVSHRDT